MHIGSIYNNNNNNNNETSVFDHLFSVQRVVYTSIVNFTFFPTKKKKKKEKNNIAICTYAYIYQLLNSSTPISALDTIITQLCIRIIDKELKRPISLSDRNSIGIAVIKGTLKIPYSA